VVVVAVGLNWTHPIQVALPKKSNMKAMMTKMPQPVMLACAFGGCACGKEATGKDAPWGGGVGAGGGGAVAVARVGWQCGRDW
jgi:hypothetical protein